MITTRGLPRAPDMIHIYAVSSVVLDTAHFTYSANDKGVSLLFKRTFPVLAQSVIFKSTGRPCCLSWIQGDYKYTLLRGQLEARIHFFGSLVCPTYAPQSLTQHIPILIA